MAAILSQPQNINACITTVPLWGESTGLLWISLIKGPVLWKMFSCHDVILVVMRVHFFFSVCCYSEIQSCWCKHYPLQNTRNRWRSSRIWNYCETLLPCARTFIWDTGVNWICIWLAHYDAMWYNSTWPTLAQVCCRMILKLTYHKVSNIRCTNSKSLNDSGLVLQMSLPNSLKLGVKSRMKM